jgi:Integrase core domain
MQNGLIERFNRTYREEVLDCYVFETLNEVRRMTRDWMTRYNDLRPQQSDPREHTASTRESARDALRDAIVEEESRLATLTAQQAESSQRPRCAAVFDEGIPHPGARGTINGTSP